MLSFTIITQLVHKSNRGSLVYGVITAVYVSFATGHRRMHCQVDTCTTSSSLVTNDNCVRCRIAGNF